MTRSLTFIYFGDYWETNRSRRRQQLAIRLAQRSEVEKLIYVELPVSLSELIKATVGVGDPLARARWKRMLRHGQRFRTGKIELIMPICLIPYFRFAAWPDKAFVRWQEDRLVRKVLQECKSDSPLLWISHPFAGGHVGKFGESLLCYDCTEDFGAFLEWSPTVRQLAQENDRMLTELSDLVLVQTPAHLEEKRLINPKIYLVPNGADLQRFESVEQRPVPADIEKLPRPILGYIGTYNLRIDGQLLIKVAKSFPQGSLVFVGEIGGDADREEIAALRRTSNVHFLGERPYGQVPDYLLHFDVCLIPFISAQDNRRGSPLKLFDYLAAGRPVVSTAISGVEDFADIVHVAEDDHAFLAGIETALQDENPNEQDKRRMRGKANSWEARVLQMWELLRTKF